MTQDSRLVTCSYTEFSSEMGIPIQTSNGAPKFKLRYTLAGAWDNVMPRRWTIRMTNQERFTRAYREHLDLLGIARLRSDRDFILERFAGDRPLALLCFERLSGGGYCHRSIFAEWWFDKTGELVPELGSVPGKAVPPPPGLF